MPWPRSGGAADDAIGLLTGGGAATGCCPTGGGGGRCGVPVATSGIACTAAAVGGAKGALNPATGSPLGAAVWSVIGPADSSVTDHTLRGAVAPSPVPPKPLASVMLSPPC